MSLKIRYIFAYFLICLTVFFVLNSIGYNHIYNRTLEQEKDVLYEEAKIISNEYVKNTRNFWITDSSIRKELRSMQLVLESRIWVVSSTGLILMDSEQNESCQGKRIGQFDSDFLSHQYIVGRYPKGLLQKERISVIYPIIDSFEGSGYIVTMSDVEKVEEKARGLTDGLLLCSLLILGIVGLILVMLAFQSIHPLKKLTKATKKYATGDFEYKVPGYLPREHNELSGAIDFLGSRVDSLIEYQKKFIGNVSHDFRSPLTSIKGYVQAISDGTIPMEMQGKYLDIILFEVERLTKLTESLLELNRLDYSGITLEQTNFDINETIKKTSATFEQKCIKKKISIELYFDKPECIVYADINKIQQVIQNLLDNAIKFSDSESSIEIHTAIHSRKVFVSVKDYGIGIPKESINKVWTRFYKTDLSRGKDKTGTGLGLSICKEIIDAHGENISVISTEGAGTEFIFSLSSEK